MKANEATNVRKEEVKAENTQRKLTDEELKQVTGSASDPIYEQAEAHDDDRLLAD